MRQVQCTHCNISQNYVSKRTGQIASQRIFISKISGDPPRNLVAVGHWGLLPQKIILERTLKWSETTNNLLVKQTMADKLRDWGWSLGKILGRGWKPAQVSRSLIQTILTEEGDSSPEEFCDLLTGINASSVSASFALRCGLRTRSGLLHEQQMVSLKPSGPKSNQYKFSPNKYQYIIKRKVHENQ